MIDYLSGLDQTLFVFINSQLANPVTDAVMPVITSDTLLRVLYVATMVLLLWRGNNRLRWLVLFSIAALVLTDQISAGLLKKWAARPRPCQELYGVHLLVNCGAGFSMPSSHAANAFGQAVLFCVHVRKALWYLVPIATLIAVSRIFVGVHYPADVVAGAALGGGVGFVFAFGLKKWEYWRSRDVVPH
ncbi:MAG TPA: phosphatase PAP2 family protein [Candidatus Deferrimicrobium sp.]|nr:phosphatase PAP2 family protein [Candidatus Deferrimicrobium sp.]